MNGHDHSARKPGSFGSFWKSRIGATLLVFLVVVAVLLGYEHRVHLLSGDGILIALLAVCVGMHLFMHGGHGGHGNQGDGQDSDKGGRP